MAYAAKIMPRSLEEVPVEKTLKAFLLECQAKNLSSRTVEWYEERIGYFLSFLKEGFASFSVSGPPIHLVTERNVKLFIQYHKQREHKRKQGHVLSSYTVRGTVVALKVFFKYLFEEEYLKENLTGKIKPPKVQKKIIQTLSEEQIKTLLETPNRKTFTGFRNYCMLLTFLDTGIRLSELVNLKVSHMDFQTNTFLVLGKGNKERRVPFGVSLRKALEKYLMWRGELPGQDFLFVNQYGEKMKNRRIEAMMETYGKKTQITGVRMSPHTLRHTFAKMSLLCGLDVMTLQHILGHTSLEMVRNYVNLTNQEIALQKNRLSIVDKMGMKAETKRKKLWTRR